MGDGFYRSKNSTNSIIKSTEGKSTKEKSDNANNKIHICIHICITIIDKKRHKYTAQQVP